MSKNVIEAAISGDAEKFARILREELFAAIKKKKEAATMQVTYNGFTGELVKLEQHRAGFANEIVLYDLTLYDSEKQAAISFTGVNLEDVKFLGGAVTFGG